MYPEDKYNTSSNLPRPSAGKSYDAAGRFAAAPASAPSRAEAEAAGAADFPALGATLPTYAQSYRPQSTPAGAYGSTGGYGVAPGAGHTGAAPGSGGILTGNRGARAGRDAQPKRANGKRIAKRIFITLLIIVALVGGYVGFKFLYNLSKTFGGNLFQLVQDDKLQGEDTGHVNILLAGNSADDVGHSGGELTDSIMIVSIDTKNNTAFMLSVPRDLWVNIPGEGYSKINAAYVDGKADNFSQSGYPSGGMGLLEKVVEQDFNINISYYALVNYTALRDAVNAVGGVDVTIKSSDPRGLYDPSRDWTGPYGTPLVKLTNGVHTLTGQQALNLARARGDTYGSYGYAQSDFTRTANQRLLLVGLKDKATSAGVLSNPVKLGQLFDSMGNNVQTDFQIKEVRRLAELGRKIPSSSIKSVSLNDADGTNLLTSYTASGGQSALIPKAGVTDYSDIQAFVAKLLTPPAPAASGSTSSSSTTTTSGSSQ